MKRCLFKYTEKWRVADKIAKPSSTMAAYVVTAILSFREKNATGASSPSRTTFSTAFKSRLEALVYKTKESEVCGSTREGMT